jgi:iron complex outermembrane receptor protein
LSTRSSARSRHPWPIGGLALGLLLQASAGHAETTSPSAALASAAAPTSPASTEQQVNVQARKLGTLDEQRLSSAAVSILNRQDIDKYGDGNVSSLLAQQPGITYNGTPGRRGGEIQMRGLGAVQLLVNGDPVPPGFTVDMLTPSLIERIEIFRVATAEHSAQAYGGTINFVLRTRGRNDKNQLGIVLAVPDDDHVGPKVQGLVGGMWHDASLSMSFSGETFRDVLTQYTNRTVTRVPDGTVDFDQADHVSTFEHGHELRLTPSASWSDPFGSSVKVEALVTREIEDHDTNYQIQQNVGDAPYTQDTGLYVSSFNVDRLTLKGAHPFGADLDSKLEGDFSFSDARWNKRESHDESGGGGDYFVGVAAVNHVSNGKLKYSKSFDENHTASVGAEGNLNRRDERWVQTLDGQPYGFDDGSRLSSSEGTGALFAQLDVKSKSYSWYLGLRGEAMRMRSRSATADTARTFEMLSPIAQYAFHFNGSDRDQLRVGLSRSYHAPRVTDLLQRSILSYNNSAFSPDVSGNPDLQPERIWNLDAALEHYGDDASSSIALYGKQIDDSLLAQTVLQPDGRWASEIANAGRTTVFGVELSGKVRLDKLVAGAPQVALQASATRNWSHVEAVRGPDNRVAGQVPSKLTFGADYPFGHWTVGTRWSWSAAYKDRSSDLNLATVGAGTVGDAYLGWKPRPSTRLKLSAGNLLHRNKRTGLVTDLGPEGEQTTDQLQRNWTTWTFSLTQDF